jgi:site-specific DNA-methyltransferase (adenine-specific)
VTSIDFRLGDYREVLADVGEVGMGYGLTEVDAVICDPPYSERVHSGHNRVLDSNRLPTRRTLDYAEWTESDVEAFVSAWSPRCRGWFVALTSHDLWGVYEKALEAAGRYVFHPIPCVIPGMSVRLSGDGPSSWAIWGVVARPRTREAQKWGTLPGAYFGRRGELSSGAVLMTGGKPLALMRALIRDYTRPGDLVCDPCAGAATTLLAAAIEGRRAIGAEMDPETYAKGKARLERGHTPVLPGLEVVR